MSKRLHSNSQIFFSDPYVVRVEYVVGDAVVDHRKISREAYKRLSGTWGVSPVQYEEVNVSSDLYSAGVVHRAYFCFQDETDALQFRLTLSTNATQVRMWPSKTRFTIHEQVEA
jgi:hypothetical protein